MDKSLVVAIVAAFAAVISPLLLSYLTGRQNKAARVEAYAREDYLAENARKLTEQLASVEERAVELGSETIERLDVIHGLVNSNMTAALVAEYEATKRELALMREVVALHKAAGSTESKELLSTIEATVMRIDEMRIVIEERKKPAEASAA